MGNEIKYIRITLGGIIKFEGLGKIGNRENFLNHMILIKSTTKIIFHHHFHHQHPLHQRKGVKIPNLITILKDMMVMNIY